MYVYSRRHPRRDRIVSPRRWRWRSETHAAIGVRLPRPDERACERGDRRLRARAEEGVGVLREQAPHVVLDCVRDQWDVEEALQARRGLGDRRAAEPVAGEGLVRASLWDSCQARHWRNVIEKRRQGGPTFICLTRSAAYVWTVPPWLSLMFFVTMPVSGVRSTA